MGAFFLIRGPGLPPSVDKKFSASPPFPYVNFLLSFLIGPLAPSGEPTTSTRTRLTLSLPGPFLQLAEATCVLGFLSRERWGRQSPRDTLGYHLATYQNTPLFFKLFCSGQVRTRLSGTAVSWDKIKTVTLDFGSDTSLCVVLQGVSPVFPSTPYWLLSTATTRLTDGPNGSSDFNIEQETKLPRSGSAHQNSSKSVKGKGCWVTAPHPPSPLRLWSRKPGRFPRCQKPVNNH